MPLATRSLAYCLLLALSGACVRRPVALELLASRSSAYRIAEPDRGPAPVPAQLPSLQRAVPAPPAAVAPSPADVAHDAYEKAYQELAKMLDGRYPLSFKRAVFLSENAYFDNRLSYEEFNGRIMELSRICQRSKTINDDRFLYTGPDRDQVARNAAIFRLIKDSTYLRPGVTLAPYRYDFEDFNGDADWRKMFVTKLLVTHRGNCHSLPFLYKIIADETGTPTWLALAPNHIYLKQHNKKDGWYNTELTSRTFPNDAWLTASGYISKETIVSGIYMDTLSAKQNVVLCLVDLAKGYERRLGPTQAEAFTLKCTELALQHFPHYINAQLLRAGALRHQFERQQTTADSQRAYAAMEAAYTRIFETGYREMPAQMYADWLRAVVKEKAKYQTQH